MERERGLDKKEGGRERDSFICLLSKCLGYPDARMWFRSLMWVVETQLLELSLLPGKECMQIWWRLKLEQVLNPGTPMLPLNAII